MLLQSWNEPERKGRDVTLGNSMLRITLLTHAQSSLIPGLQPCAQADSGLTPSSVPGGALALHPPSPRPFYGMGGALAPHSAPLYGTGGATPRRPLRGWPRRGGAALLTRPGPARRRAAAAILCEPPAG